MSFLITLADRGDSVEGDGFGWVFVYLWLFEGKEIVFSENEWSPLCRGRGTCAMFLIFWTICLRSHCGWFIRAIFLEISSSTPSIEVTIIISWVVNSVVKAIQWKDSTLNQPSKPSISRNNLTLLLHLSASTNKNLPILPQNTRKIESIITLLLKTTWIRCLILESMNILRTCLVHLRAASIIMSWDRKLVQKQIILSRSGKIVKRWYSLKITVNYQFLSW